MSSDAPDAAPAQGKAAKPRTRPRAWTDEEIGELVRGTPTETDRRRIDQGYLPVNRGALHGLLTLQSYRKHPSHAEASLLLRLLARSAWQPGREGLVLGTQSEVARLVEHRSLDAFIRAMRELEAAGFVDELRNGRAVVAYQIRHDVYDWLVHPDRPDCPGRIADADHAGRDCGHLD